MVDAPLHLSVVIPTRNRPGDVRRCLESLAAVRYPRWEVLVVDQSDTVCSREIVESFADVIPNLRYLALASKGASRSRNAGLEAATGECVAFVDDDCAVDPTWLDEVASAFERYPQAILMFGKVIAAPHDSNEYYVTTADIRHERAWKGRLSSLRIKGIGAAMSVRRVAYDVVGPFDVYFGPGSGFAPAGEEEDYCFRCLSSGYEVVEVPSVVVQHFGARATNTGAASILVSGYGFSGGMLAMKMIRTRDPLALAFLCARLWQYCRWINWVKVIQRRKSSGLRRLAMFLNGLKASFKLEVDRRQCLYWMDAK